MSQVHVLYADIGKYLNERFHQYYLEMLPVPLRIANLKYKRKEDRVANLFGKLLLLEGLDLLHIPRAYINDLSYNKHKRPYIKGLNFLDFNISHSGDYVLCAISETTRVGVDIERIDSIDFQEYSETMNEHQWQEIARASNPLAEFYHYWTIKESVIKADSRTFEIPLKDIHVQNNWVTIEKTRWFLSPLNINENYCSVLASSVENVVLHQHRLF